MPISRVYIKPALTVDSTAPPNMNGVTWPVLEAITPLTVLPRAMASTKGRLRTTGLDRASVVNALEIDWEIVQKDKVSACEEELENGRLPNVTLAN